MDEITVNITEEIEEIQVNITEGSTSFVSGGEANTMSSEGTGASIVLPKSGVNMPVKGFKAGTNVSISATADSLEISASGETITASNGLTKTGTDISLEGEYRTERQITSAENVDFIIKNTNNGTQQLKIEPSGLGLTSNDTGTKQSLIYVAPTYAELSNLDMGSGMTIQLHSTNGIKITDATLSKGAIYAADYSANSTARSLIDKAEIEGLIAASGGGAIIQDTATTTSLDTENATYPNQIIGKAPAATTGLILQLFSGTNPNFQVDGNGDIKKNGSFILKTVGTSIHIANNIVTETAGNSHISIGVEAMRYFTNTNSYAIGIGYKALYLGSGNYAIGIGLNAGYNYKGGSISIGVEANKDGGTQAKTSIGYQAGKSSSGAAGTFLGDYAGVGFSSGAYAILDGLNRTDMAGGLAKSAIICSLDATATNQFMRTNTKFCVNAAPLTNMVAGDALLEGGSLILKEITTPTADANYGKIYTKSDNKIYFQDGDGTEHEIAFV